MKVALVIYKFSVYKLISTTRRLLKMRLCGGPVTLPKNNHDLGGHVALVGGGVIALHMSKSKVEKRVGIFTHPWEKIWLRYHHQLLRTR